MTTTKDEYLYLLHFNEPLSHAKHYLGSCEDVSDRVDRHHRGAGAKITRAVREKGIGWTIAAVFAIREGCSKTRREIERHAKQRKNSCSYCPICRGKVHFTPDFRVEVPIKNIIQTEYSGCEKSTDPTMLTTKDTSGSRNPKKDLDSSQTSQHELSKSTSTTMDQEPTPF